MKYIISVFLYLIGLPIFLFVGITTIILTYLFKPRQYDKFVKLLCRMILKAFFIRVKVSGLKKIDPKKTYVFMSNHVNIFDPFILNGYIPNFARGLELDSHFEWPVWGKMITRFGNIPISHTHAIRAMDSLKIAEKAINNGTSIFILPEGHRTRDGKLRTFMRGPFLLAQKTKADIVPIAMVGSFEIKKVKNWVVKPGTVKFMIGDVIPYESTRDISTKKIRDLVKDKIQLLIDNSN